LTDFKQEEVWPASLWWEWRISYVCYRWTYI